MVTARLGLVLSLAYGLRGLFSGQGKSNTVLEKDV